MLHKGIIKLLAVLLLEINLLEFSSTCKNENRKTVKTYSWLTGSNLGYMFMQLSLARKIFFFL